MDSYSNSQIDSGKARNRISGGDNRRKQKKKPKRGSNFICPSTKDFFRPAGNMTAKRIFDLIFSVSGLLFISVVFLFIAIWIKIDSPGPVFFRQIRIGQYGKRFRIYKFRTMIYEAERFGKHFTVGNDPRITRSGKFLRKYKLDELPQLLNVVWGQMSLVGPRPQVPQHVAEYPSYLKNIVLSVPPGITGFASLVYINESEILKVSENADQIYKKLIIPAKLKLYVKYVFHRNLLLDVKLIFLTIFAVIKICLHLPRKTTNLTEFNSEYFGIHDPNHPICH